jgi:hypothetical protein
VRDWARLYQTPLWLTAGFVVLLALFAVTPDPARSSADDGAAATSEPTPGPGECVICGIDQECDPSSGRCMFVKATPLPCVESAKFDEKAGFCLPTGAPTPVPTVEPLEEESPGRERIPRSRADNFPFDTDEPDEETPEPEPEETEEPDRDRDENFDD